MPDYEALTVDDLDCPICIEMVTGKSFSEALILTSTNPKYDEKLFIELRVQYMKIANLPHVVYTNCFDIQNNLCTQHVLSLQFSCTDLVIQ